MISSRIKPSRFAIPLGGAISIVAVALLCGGCERHVQVTKEMTWECLPEERGSRYPDAEPVMFRYVEDSEYFDVASGLGLCQQLRTAGKTTAKVAYEVWGGPLQKLHGYRIEAVNGQPLRDVGGPARSGHHGMSKGSRHPLTSALE